MPTSNETRVRVDGRSKIIARVLPASGRDGASAPLTRAAFIAAARIEDAAKLPGRKLEQIEEMPRLGMNGRVHGSFQLIATARRSFDRLASGVEPPHAFGHLLVGDHEGRQDAHDIVAGGNEEKLLLQRRLGESWPEGLSA